MGDSHLLFRIAGATAEDEARSLLDWLILDRAIRRSARLELVSSTPSAPGQQGTGILDVVSLVLSNGISAASLAVSIASWRATRPQAPVVTIERPDGSKVTITGTSSTDAQQLVEQLLGEQQ